MKELIVLPVIMLMIVGVATELESIAQDSSDKVIKYADDMNMAMDCATQGIPISVCSPDLMKTDFSAEKERYIAALQALNQTNSSSQQFS